MAENETPADEVHYVMVQNLNQAKAIANRFEFVEKSIASSPLGAGDQTKTFRGYVEQSVAASFDLSARYYAQRICRMSCVFRQSSFKNNCKL